MKRPYLLILLTAAIIGCSKEDNKNSGPGGEGLHMSFKTPDWSEYINCEQLVLDATNSGVLTATSESTKETFYLTVPQDSSLFGNSANVKRYPIGSADDFHFNQTLPYVKGSSIRLIGQEKMDGDNYNEVTSVKYDHSDEKAAYFRIQANYKMTMKVLHSSSTDTIKNVTGTYHLMIKTNKK